MPAAIPAYLFQSTLPRGSDLLSVNPSKIFITISIHAPSRERPPRPLREDGIRHFNPRSLAGATRDDVQRGIWKPFQSTLPRGSDANDWKLLGNAMNFNPRSLAGATICLLASNGPISNFNPRSLAGATSNHKYSINF